MSRWRPHLPWMAAVVLVAVLPINGELLCALPALAAAFVFLALGTWALLVRRERGWTGLGIGSLVLAQLLAPAACWPAFLVPAARHDLGARRWWLAAGLAAVLAVCFLLSPILEEAGAELGLRGPGKAREAMSLVRNVLVAGALPWEMPILGLRHNDDPISGAIITAGALVGLWGLVRWGIRRTGQVWVLLFLMGVVAPVVPTLLSRPHMATGALAAWLPWGTLAFLATRRLLVMRPSRSTWALRTGAAFLLGVHLVSLVPKSLDHWQTWSDPRRSFEALLAENPISPYRWDYALWLDDQGLEAAPLTRGPSGTRRRAPCSEQRLRPREARPVPTTPG